MYYTPDPPTERGHLVDILDAGLLHIGLTKLYSEIVARGDATARHS